MKRHGFTLIEVLIVIAIIGILSAVVLIGLSPFRASARDSRRIQDLKNLQPAIELYYARTASYPADTWAALRTALVPVYISNLPTDPGTNTYIYCSSGTEYVLSATLEAENQNAMRAQVGATIPSIGSCSCGTTLTSTEYCIWGSQ